MGSNESALPGLRVSLAESFMLQDQISVLLQTLHAQATTTYKSQNW